MRIPHTGRAGFAGAAFGATCAAFGGGVRDTSMAGFPHFAEAVFEGAFPWAKVTFSDDSFPGKPSLAAWSSFIPMNADDSSLPCAFYEVEIKNTSDETTAYTIAYTLGSMFDNGVNAPVNAGDIKGISISEGENGMCAVTDAPGVHVQPSWFRGSWFDGPTVYWNEFSSGEPLMERSYAGPGRSPGAMEVRLELAPGESLPAFVLDAPLASGEYEARVIIVTLTADGGVSSRMSMPVTVTVAE